jgi:hypothetical protein
MMKRITIKEIRKWIKSLEESRYRKVYYPDARRVAWFVNNSTLKEADMPESMVKKWKLAEYRREKFLAKKYMREVLNQKINESKLRKLIQRLVTEQIK